MTPLDIAWVRAQFPAFAAPGLAGQSFFENAGGSFPCRPVVDRLHRFYCARKVQPYAPYAVSEAAGAEMDEARARLSAMLNIAPEELSFGPSTTANIYVLAQAVRRWLRPGAAVVVTDQDHEANSGPWRRLAEDGVEIREWRLDPATGRLDPDRLRPLLADGRARLLAFPHCSNVLAEINDVAAICALARDQGARTVVDGVSYAPHGLPDLGALGCDAYLFSAYKTYGPHQGILAIRADWGWELPNQGHHFNAGSLSKRLTPAGPDHAQVAAAAGIADYLEALSAHHGGPVAGAPAARHAHDLMRAAEERLLQPLLDGLAGRGDLRLLGPRDAARRAPTVALALGRPAEPVARALAAHGVLCGGGDFYAPRPLEALGIDPAAGVLRLSFVHYAEEADIERALRALRAVLGP